MPPIIDLPQQLIELTAARARAATNAPLDSAEQTHLKAQLLDQLRQQNAILVAHFYVDESLQDLADDSGGMVGDSLEMARYAYEHEATTIVIAGVKFMAETAKILSPQKRVLLIEQQAECSLDIGCPSAAFNAFCDAHPGRTVVVYANTSAAVKARADWVVTSSIALELCTYLKDKGEKLLWAPDRFLGNYIQRQTGADMVLWQGSCIVHEEFKAQELLAMKQQHPKAAVLVHPEAPMSVIELADVVGSTSKLLAATKKLPQHQFIVATESGIFHKMQQLSPEKQFISAPTAGHSATCKSCAQCPWMKMNDLQRLQQVLADGSNAIHIEPQIRQRAARALKRMVDFAKRPGLKLSGDA